MITKMNEAVLLLLDGGPKTPEQMTFAMNKSPDFADLRAKWGGSVTRDQVYAAMSGLRRKHNLSRCAIVPEGGEPSINKTYAITPFGRREIERLDLTPLKPPVVTESEVEHVDHPAHYGGGDNPYEAIRVIEAWDLDFCLGNTVKYISRAGKKNKAREVEDLQKARWYLDRRIGQLGGS